MGSVAAVLFDCRMGFTLLPTSQLIQRPSGTPSFAARRKIEEKDTPRRRKLHILRFAFRGKSSVVPLCPEEIPLGDSSSPHQTHFVGLWRGPCPKAALWNLAFLRGLGGETCPRPTNSP